MFLLLFALWLWSIVGVVQGSGPLLPGVFDPSSSASNYSTFANATYNIMSNGSLTDDGVRDDGGDDGNGGDATGLTFGELTFLAVPSAIMLAAMHRLAPFHRMVLAFCAVIAEDRRRERERRRLAAAGEGGDVAPADDMA
ncbi:hypothetical protein BDK51DRAFT_52753 [Blyttiomyces helicus]|uniref:Uncharacterized protein n=1 Tax=Blyttiomyces helicus TaxID=388810 RepID=A0A4P9WE83_9FUNG|nr:hypothetical protein BDK51DRAFT_52753 [Blyttiomyces helicus]|eukprot:RKO89558.1 hypothetical protein BDK51DRAFT_52753 [Blyttiomyces helicus]